MSFQFNALYSPKTHVRPPIAQEVPKIDTLHDDIRVDNYYWLREKSNPEVIKYLNAENSYTESMTAHFKDLQDSLYQEILSRIKETDLTVPVKIDSYYYYSRTEEGKQYSIYCRKKGSLDAEEEILLDQNELAVGHEYLALGVYKVSPNHRFLAYSIDTTGEERYTLYIKDLDKHMLCTEEIPNTGYAAAWANDNLTIFYTILDDTKRPYKLYRHILGIDSNDDVFVYQEPDETMFLYIGKTKNEEYLLMQMNSHTTSEEHYLSADNPTGEFQVIQPRESEVEYYVDAHGDRFFILTNDNAENFKLMETPIANPHKENWKEVIGHRDSVKIDGFDVFADYLIVYEMEKGLQNIRVMNLIDNETYYIDFPEPVYSVWHGDNPEFNTTLLRFNYTSLITPQSVFDYDMATQTRELLKQYEVLGGYDPSQYQSERIFARATDSTMVPISLVYKKDMIKKNGGNPLWLHAYGAYGSDFEPYFSRSRLSILDRGFIYAIAHVRGGGEMGRYWYDQGKLFNKMNTFTDFIACAEHVIAEGYTSSDKLVIEGGSAGGLLIGAVVNMRPDLFYAVVVDVPFVDLLNTMLDPTLPLTVLEYEEWGNPHEKQYYDYMKLYSPYDNVKAQIYPHMLITAGLNDTRVMYWEAAKWTARLRSLKTDNNVLLLKTNMGTGHLGASGRYDYLKDIAFQYAFIFDLFGIKK
jgi:oligopeptidase B